jgi:hypothetical protein
MCCSSPVENYKNETIIEHRQLKTTKIKPLKYWLYDK